MIKSGFQIPVYILQGPNENRVKRVTAHVKAAGFEHIIFNSDYKMGNISQKEKDEFYHVTPPADKATKEEMDLCVATLDATVHNLPLAQRECALGQTLSERYFSPGMKHIAVQKQALNCKTPPSCISNATLPALQYALILEVYSCLFNINNQ
jgi:hypothetical protein